MRVLTFGTYDAGLHPRVAVLIEGLRANGHDVTEINEPLRLSTAQRVAVLRQPWRLPVLGWQLARTWARLVGDTRGRPRPDVVLVGFLGHFDVLLARRLFRRTPIVLDHLISAEETARDRGSSSRLVLGLLRLLDRLALQSADVVVVDTEEHRSLVPDERQDQVVVVPVGADTSWFAAGEAGRRAETDRLRVVFFGLYTPLQGAGVIGEAAQLLAGDPVEITMIGHGQDLDATRREAAGNPQVTWLDWVDGAELPAVVASHEVCLGIFGTNPKSQRIVPNKVFQGMAAGCAIVTSDTAPQRRLLEDAAVFVPSGDAEALADALRTLAADRALLDEMRARSAKLARHHLNAGTVTAELASVLAAREEPGRLGR